MLTLARPATVSAVLAVEYDAPSALARRPASSQVEPLQW